MQVRKEELQLVVVQILRFLPLVEKAGKNLRIRGSSFCEFLVMSRESACKYVDPTCLTIITLARRVFRIFLGNYFELPKITGKVDSTTYCHFYCTRTSQDLVRFWGSWGLAVAKHIKQAPIAPLIQPHFHTPHNTTPTPR